MVILYYLIPGRYRWALLLAASYFFYGSWKIEFLSLIVFSTLVDFQVGKWLYKQTNTLYRRILLGASLASNIGLLFIFKYLKLFLPAKDAMIVNIYTVDHPIIGLVAQAVYFSIPVGISFYTFQTLSYTLDIFNKRIEPETHLGKFALFVTFFPQLVAGPIERFSRLMPQLKANHLPVYENFSNAFRLILYGFFVKLCIADNLSPMVDAVYANPSGFGTGSLWFGTFAFGLQIYADFAGYTLIAQGAALCLGIKLMDNFKTPYLSTSIGEFWSRWHISLSTWFRDYVYIPLGGNRVRVGRWVINILLVFVISGFWHGANYTFLIWGGIHGGLYLVERMFKGLVTLPSTRLTRLAGWAFIFAAVHLAWVFFRIEHIDMVGDHFAALFTTTGVQSITLKPELIVMLLVFIVSDVVLYNGRIDHWLGNRPKLLRWSMYGVMLWCITAWAGMANHPFIYFQF